MIHRLVPQWKIRIDYGIAGGSSAEIVDALVPKLLPGGISEASRREIVAFLDGLHVVDGLHVADWRRLREAAAMVLSTPEFQRH